jgi:signal transduction histidine kinase
MKTLEKCSDLKLMEENDPLTMISQKDSEIGESTDLRPSSLISRNGYVVLPSAIIIYVVLQLLVTYNTKCNDQKEFLPWTQDYFLGAGFVFSVSAMQHLAKGIYIYHNDSTLSYKKFMIHMAAVTISLIAGSSSLLTYVYNSGICQFDVEGQASLWSEWVICAPLLAYIVISEDDKGSLSYIDVGVIASITILVLFLLLIVFTFTDHATDRILFIFGCLSLLISMVLTLIKVIVSRKDFGKYSRSRKTLSLFLLVINDSLFRFTWAILPLLPILLYIYDKRIINRDQLQIAYIILTLFAFWIFLNAIVEDQIHVAQKIRFREEAETLANATRRTFLRYVFHELRIPLNTVTMGMAVLENDEELCGESKKALNMMNGATSFINDTLNDVLFMHELGEGAIKVLKNSFNLGSIIMNPISAVGHISKLKNISIISKVCIDYENPVIIGDKKRLENVVISFLKNSIKLSSENSKINVTVTIKCNNDFFHKSLITKLTNSIRIGGSFQKSSVNSSERYVYVYLYVYVYMHMNVYVHFCIIVFESVVHFKNLL